MPRCGIHGDDTSSGRCASCDRHHDYAEWIAGLGEQQGLQCELVGYPEARVEARDGGTYAIKVAIGLWPHEVTLVIPYPPDEWQL